jgi:hypothetical protein
MYESIWWDPPHFYMIRDQQHFWQCSPLRDTEMVIQLSAVHLAEGLGSPVVFRPL